MFIKHLKSLKEDIGLVLRILFHTLIVNESKFFGRNLYFHTCTELLKKIIQATQLHGIKYLVGIPLPPPPGIQ